jgi:hypothetical protein
MLQSIWTRQKVSLLPVKRYGHVYRQLVATVRACRTSLWLSLSSFMLISNYHLFMLTSFRWAALANGNALLPIFEIGDPDHLYFLCLECNICGKKNGNEIFLVLAYISWTVFSSPLYNFHKHAGPCQYKLLYVQLERDRGWEIYIYIFMANWQHRDRERTNRTKSKSKYIELEQSRS